MGGGSSSSNITPSQSIEIVKKMKEEYQIILNNNNDNINNISIEKQKDILINKYNEIYYQVMNTPHYMIPKGVKVNSSNTINHNSTNRSYQRGISKDITSSKTRRRSFDNNKTIKKGLSNNSNNSNNLPILEKASSLQESQSSPIISSEEQQVDSWDSVNNQPSCILCGMVFSTMTKLETHVKYSALHTSNLLREQKMKDDEEKRISDSLKVIEEPPLALPQEPCERCRIFYSGTKFFWKQQQNIDIYIYLHIQQNIIEIIGFTDKSLHELPRLYFDVNKLVEYIGEDLINQRLNDYIADASNQRFKETLPSKSILYEDMKRRVISSHLLSSIHLTTQENDSKLKLVYNPPDITSDNNNDNNNNNITSKTTNNNVSIQDIIYLQQPKDVIPVFIPRKRHSTEEDIRDTVNNIQNIQENIRDLTLKAEILSSIVSQGVILFLSEGRKRKHRYEVGTYSHSTKYWKIAIHQILLQLRVQKTREFLKKFNYSI